MRRRGRSKPRGLQVDSDARYALLPREVAESAAYHALPDWARSVLTALLLQYAGSRNGSLALPIKEAAALGVRQAWHVYAGLRLLCDCDLVVLTRRGHLTRGGKLPSLFGLTWRGIDEPGTGVVYDAGIGVCPIPTNAWARWTRHDDWESQVRAVIDRARGTGTRGRARERVRRRVVPIAIAAAGRLRTKNPVTPGGGTDRPHSGGTEHVAIAPPAGGRKVANVVPLAGVASEISPTGAGLRAVRSLPPAERGLDVAIARMVIAHGHLLDRDIARSCSADVERVAHVRALIADGWRP